MSSGGQLVQASGNGTRPSTALAAPANANASAIEDITLTDAERAPLQHRRATQQKYGIGTYVLLPYRFLFDNEFFESKLYGRSAAAAVAHGADSVGAQLLANRRIVRPTMDLVPCKAGCGQNIAVSYSRYNAKTSPYLICSAACAEPIAAHKDCLQRAMLENNESDFVYPHALCSGAGIRMHCDMRLAPSQLPWTLMSAVRGTLRLALLSLVFNYVFYVILYAKAWMDYRQGLSAIRPTNPFAFNYTMFNSDDSSFIWDTAGWGSKLLLGFLFYTMCRYFLVGLTWLGWGLEKFCCVLFNTTPRKLLYRYNTKY